MTAGESTTQAMLQAEAAAKGLAVEFDNTGRIIVRGAFKAARGVDKIGDLGFNDAPGRIGNGQLEDRLCQINGNGCSIHVGLLSIVEDLIPTPMKTRAPMWRKQTGESIPSFDTDAERRSAASLLHSPPVAGHLQR
ncbi:MAG: hypothetical protein H0X13_06605 [Ramlibacter sp.]|nr:hypothetical protein [Ramlibacter sp.]